MQSSAKLFVFLPVLRISLMSYSVVLGVDIDHTGFEYDDYATVLQKYVDDIGMVDYQQLKADRSKLDAFVAALAKLEGKTYEGWTEKGKIAFWLNAYNCLTLKVIIDNYPIESSFFRSMYYPESSIRQIKGVWDKITFTVLGKEVTLGHLEHKVLRKKFDEPQIHMAMVCAAMGCPPLLNEPYRGERVDKQLDEQSHHFLNNRAKFKTLYICRRFLNGLVVILLINMVRKKKSGSIAKKLQPSLILL
jgi:hypothetical protein